MQQRSVAQSMPALFARIRLSALGAARSRRAKAANETAAVRAALAERQSPSLVLRLWIYKSGR